MTFNCIPPELIANLKEQVTAGKIKPEDVAKMLPEEKAALKSILEDFVAEKLGVSVSKGEIQQIQVKSKAIDAAQAKLGDDLGNPAKTQENIDFFKAKKAMDDYLGSVNPSHKVKVLTGTIGRGMMLFSAKSPLLNIGSNIEVGITEALSRRIANAAYKGGDNALAVNYVKMVNKVYQASGYDISRMTSMVGDELGGGRFLGKYQGAQGPGVVRKVGRGIEDIVFKQMMGAPDVAFSAAHFADSVNLNSLKMTKGDTVAASALMKDAMRVEPLTPEGEILRAQAVLDAQVATWTNTTWASQVSSGIRKILNDVSGDARVGDYVLPFVKTPANVIATGMDYAGMGIPKALVKAVKAFRTGDLGSREVVQGISRDLVRAGLGITGAVIITSQLSNDDFMGAYDPARAQIEQLRNSNTNAIRVMGHWISTDWLGPLAIPVTAMMYGRKYSNTPPEFVFQYAKGVGAAALNIPGVSDIYSQVKANAFKQNQNLEQMTGATADYLATQAYSRLVPSFLSDLAKATDPYVRQTDNKSPLGVIKGLGAKIPFVSQTYPIKTDIFGQPIKGEPAITDILFGSRVKTDKSTPLINELSKVSADTGKGITFTDWSKSTSATLAQFKQKVGGIKYDEAKLMYGQELKKQLETTITKPAYKKLSPEEKLKVLNGKDSDAMTKVFQHYGFKYKATRSTIPKNL